MPTLIFWLELLLVIFFIVGGSLIFFVFNRKRQSDVMIVLKDFRNPATPIQKWYIIYDKKNDYMKMYKNLIQPFKTRAITPFDRNEYRYDKRIYAFKGVSGQVGDDNYVPIHYPIVSQAGASLYANEMSSAILRTLAFQKVVEDKGLHVGDQVSFETKKGEIDGEIIQINHTGVLMQYIVTVKEKQEVQLMLISEKPDVDKLTITKAATNPKPMDLSSFFTKAWVLQMLGITPVQNVNVIVAATKSAVSSFNSKVDTRVAANQGWFERHQMLFYGIVFMLVITVCLGIALQSVEGFLHGIATETSTASTTIQNTAIAAIASVASAAGGHIPSTVVTPPPTTNGSVT